MNIYDFSEFNGTELRSSDTSNISTMSDANVKSTMIDSRFSTLISYTLSWSDRDTMSFKSTIKHRNPFLQVVRSAHLHRSSFHRVPSPLSSACFLPPCDARSRASAARSRGTRCPVSSLSSGSLLRCVYAHDRARVQHQAGRDVGSREVRPVCREQSGLHP